MGDSGRYSNPEYYPNFQSITGVDLNSATTDDMVLYWYCENTNPRGKCTGLQAPCGRSCGGSSSSSCGYVPDSCSSDLDWAANTGTKSHSWWYPNFETQTGVSLYAATREDVQLYFVCTGETVNGNCDGLEKPCGRDCGGSDASAFTASDGDSGSDDGHVWVWIVVAVCLTMSLLLCVVLLFYVLRTKKKEKGRDEVQLKDDQQIEVVDEQMIELEESVEKDGDVTTMGLTA